MNVVILTPEKEVFKGSATSVKVPGIGGAFEVLRNHAPVVSGLENGTVRVLAEGGKRLLFHINSGFVEVLNNEVSILAQGLTAE
ncbi:MAG: ATP synthase F1 subunit epsilon [Saprospiraceae bacterium]